MRVSREEFDRAIASARSESERILYLGALLGRATEADPIITGGSAIYLHAPELAPSLDVDVSVVPRTSAAEAIESWGFERRKGRLWRREDLGIDVDLVGEFRGSRRRAKIIATPYGDVRVACVEDMVLKRLAELKHWQTGEAWRDQIVEQVTVLLADYGPEIDEIYLESLARRDDVVDILADFRRNVESGPRGR
jgi:hypothetical protein